MDVQQISDRAVASGAVDEVNAAVGACLCTGQASVATAAVLRQVQAALSEVALIVSGRSDGRAGLDRHLIGLEGAADRWTGDRPVEDPLAAGHCLAAGLLRLARTVAERAARSVAALERRDREMAWALDCLTVLPGLLDAVARELDLEEERSVPVDVWISR